MKYLKFKTPAADHAADLRSDYGLKNHGLVHLDTVYLNLPTPALVERDTLWYAVLLPAINDLIAPYAG